MVTLYRCDICFDLIDPVEGDERIEMTVQLRDADGETDTASIDFCEECAPESAGKHFDWLTHTLEDERSFRRTLVGLKCIDGH